MADTHTHPHGNIITVTDNRTTTKQSPCVSSYAERSSEGNNFIVGSLFWTIKVNFQAKKYWKLPNSGISLVGICCLSCVTCGRELKNSLKMSAREVIYFILTFSRAEDKPFNSSKHPKRSLSPAPNCEDFLFSMS